MMQDLTRLGSFNEREARERALAALAEHPAVAAMHRELADHYRQLAAPAPDRTSR